MTKILAATRGRTLVVLMALVATVTVLSAVSPSQSVAATPKSTVTYLAQGAGMGDHPSTAVRRVQRVLDRHGYDLGAPGVDGRFGPITDAAVRQLQTDRGLVSDGIVGPHTRRALGLHAGTAPVRNGSTQAGKRKTGTKAKTKPATKAPTSSKPTSKNTNSTKDHGTTTKHKSTPAPVAAPTRSTDTSDNGGDLTWIVAVLAVIGGFLGTFAALVSRDRRGRRKDTAPPSVAPVTGDVYLEGESEQAGAFRGRAIAASVSPGPDDDPAHGETHYLVDDARQPAPVWVDANDVHRTPDRLGAGEPVIGYVTLAPEAGSDEADDPVRAIAEAAEAAGWRLVDVVTDRQNGRGLGRPGLTYALSQIAEGKARGLVVSDLRLLSRSIVDLGALMEWFRDAGAALIAVDLGLDTSTPSGHEAASMLVTLGGWERERIARRTRSGLAAVRAEGRPAGRPAVSDRPELTERIIAMRDAGMTLQAIADQLNAEEVPTLRGGAMWRPSSVQAALGYRRPASRGPLPPLEEERQG
jgi:DNA invertase Pin-like site-specific DNA recombinase/peptidoglycan hydrolase-like protein with peptidoglycan-binding domain